MKVRYKNHEGKWVTCEGCVDSNCPNRDCFAPGYYQHRSCNNQHNSGYDDYQTCLTNQYHGCPDDAFEDKNK